LNTSLKKSELKQYIAMQCGNFFPDKYRFDGEDVDAAMDLALLRSEYCFRFIDKPQYNRDGQVWFDHLHSDQYATFLYFLSNSLWKKSQNKPLCDKLLLLNKALNCFFLSYKCGMPDIFALGHPVGTIIGNAEYSNFLVVSQNVTINTETPPTRLGKGVFLAAGANIIGSGIVGDYSSIGIGTTVYKKDIPDNCIAFTDSSGAMIVKESDRCAAQLFFNVDVKKYND
jgi:serine O-acetyltransferase